MEKVPVRMVGSTHHPGARWFTRTILAVTLGSIGSGAHATLLDRWSFSETSGTTLVDSVGGHNAVIVGSTATSTLGGGKVTLSGGVGANYVSLGGGLLTGRSSATLEIWGTQLSIQNWGRIFDIGSSLNISGTPSDSYLEWSWNSFNSGSQTQVGWMTNGVRSDNYFTRPFSLGTEYNITVTIADGAGPGGTTLVELYVNGALFSTINHASTLASLPDNFFTLGKSMFPGDAVANASYDEVRLYGTALTASQVAQTYAAGPNSVPVPEPMSIGGLALSLLGLTLARRRRATGDDKFTVR